MMYKTITFELLELHPELADRLKRAGLLHLALEACSRDLRTHHLLLTDRFYKARPTDGPEDCLRQAFEIALRHLEERIRQAADTQLAAEPEELLERLRLATPIE